MLKGLDMIVFDMQDIGVRYYTYLSTLTYVLESAAEYGIPVLVLDRVNPLGREVEGPMLAEELKSFVGMHPIPIRHGMTLGELAMMINGEDWLANGIQADLTIISYNGTDDGKMRENALNPAPSPNMRDLETAWLYQGLCLLEGTNLSEGRVTDLPFKLFGAPWLDANKLLQELQDINKSNNEFKVIHFTPQSTAAAKYPKYEGEECQGIQIIHLENPLEWTIQMLQTVKKLNPEEFKFLESNFIDKLYGSDKLRLSIQREGEVMLLFEQFKLDREAFLIKRKDYLIY